MEGNSTTPKNCVLTEFLHQRSTIFLLVFSLIRFWILLRNEICISRELPVGEKKIKWIKLMKKVIRKHSAYMYQNLNPDHQLKQAKKGPGFNFWNSVLHFMKTRYYSWWIPGLAWKGLWKYNLVFIELILNTTDIESLFFNWCILWLEKYDFFFVIFFFQVIHVLPISMRHKNFWYSSCNLGRSQRSSTDSAERDNSFLKEKLSLA